MNTSQKHRTNFCFQFRQNIIPLLFTLCLFSSYSLVTSSVLSQCQAVGSEPSASSTHAIAHSFRTSTYEGRSPLSPENFVKTFFSLPNSQHQLSILRSNGPGRKVLLSGHPGTGKTYFCTAVANSWKKEQLEENIQSLYLLSADKLYQVYLGSSQDWPSTLVEAISQHCFGPQNADPQGTQRLEQIKKSLNTNTTLVIIDGLEHMEQCIGSLLQEAQRGKYRLLITARPYAVPLDLHSAYPEYTKIVMLGLSQESLTQYIPKFLTKQKQEELFGISHVIKEKYPLKALVMDIWNANNSPINMQLKTQMLQQLAQYINQASPDLRNFLLIQSYTDSFFRMFLQHHDPMYESLKQTMNPRLYERVKDIDSAKWEAALLKLLSHIHNFTSSLQMFLEEPDPIYESLRQAMNLKEIYEWAKDIDPAKWEKNWLELLSHIHNFTSSLQTFLQDPSYESLREAMNPWLYKQVQDIASVIWQEKDLLEIQSHIRNFTSFLEIFLEEPDPIYKSLRQAMNQEEMYQQRQQVEDSKRLDLFLSFIDQFFQKLLHHRIAQWLSQTRHSELYERLITAVCQDRYPWRQTHRQDSTPQALTAMLWNTLGQLAYQVRISRENDPYSISEDDLMTSLPQIDGYTKEDFLASGLLLSDGPGVYKFITPTIQQYFAGRWLASQLFSQDANSAEFPTLIPLINHPQIFSFFLERVLKATTEDQSQMLESLDRLKGLVRLESSPGAEKLKQTLLELLLVKDLIYFIGDNPAIASFLQESANHIKQSCKNPITLFGQELPGTTKLTKLMNALVCTDSFLSKFPDLLDFLIEITEKVGSHIEVSDVILGFLSKLPIDDTTRRKCLSNIVLNAAEHLNTLNALSLSNSCFEQRKNIVGQTCITAMQSLIKSGAIKEENTNVVRALCQAIQELPNVYPNTRIQFIKALGTLKLQETSEVFSVVLETLTHIYYNEEHEPRVRAAVVQALRSNPNYVQYLEARPQSSSV